MCVNPPANHGLHHGQVLEVIMSLEQSITREELDKDAADAPDITGE